VSFVTSLRQIPDASDCGHAGEPGVIGKQCNGDWCEMSFDGHSGWISQAQVWGRISRRDDQGLGRNPISWLSQ
jgi:SH3-like domain-containing protein